MPPLSPDMLEGLGANLGLSTAVAVSHSWLLAYLHLEVGTKLVVLVCLSLFLAECFSYRREVLF